MAVDFFLKIDPIKGESTDKSHKDEIEVLSWSWGAAQSGTAHSGTGAGGGKVSVQDLSITKYVDKGSTDLMKFLARGKHIDKAVLVCRKAGDNPLEYHKLTLETVIVSGRSLGGTGSDDRLIEHVTLNFQKFKEEYKQQTDKGAAGASPHFNWDIAANSEY